MENFVRKNYLLITPPLSRDLAIHTLTAIVIRFIPTKNIKIYPLNKKSYRLSVIWLIVVNPKLQRSVIFTALSVAQCKQQHTSDVVLSLLSQTSNNIFSSQEEKGCIKPEDSR